MKITLEREGVFCSQILTLKLCPSVVSGDRTAGRRLQNEVGDFSDGNSVTRSGAPSWTAGIQGLEPAAALSWGMSSRGAETSTKALDVGAGITSRVFSPHAGGFSRSHRLQF